MNVLHLIDTGGPGGAETVFHRLVTGLAERGYGSVAVVPVVDWLHSTLVASGVEPVVLPQGGSADLKYVLALRHLLSEHRISLVHTHLLGSAVYASLATLGLGVPVVSTFHGLPDFPTGLRFRRIKLGLIQRSSNRLVFVSNSLRGVVLERLGLRANRCSVIHNGVDFHPPTLRGSERSELGAEAGDFLAVAVGNIRPAKDYITLIEATARVRARGIPLRVAILGEGSGALREQLEGRCRTLDLDGAIHFLGFRPDATRLLAAADVFVNSSYTEGFSLGTVEALSLARPVVATRSGGPEEIVQDGETGRLVSVGDPDALAQGLLAVYNDRAGAREMADRGRQDVHERFDVELMLDRYEALYRDLTAKPRRRASH